MKCRFCDEDAIGLVKVDPYDVISESPILSEASYCLTHYNMRIIAALEWLKRLTVKESP